MTGFENELWVTAGASTFSAVVILIGGLFVLFQNPRRDLNWLFFIFTLSTLAYIVFFIIASLQTEHDPAYFWWFMNIFDALIAGAVVHFTLRVINLQREWAWFIILTYASAAAIIAVGFVHPTWFLPDVVPKLYFPYYLTAGWWYYVMLAQFALFPLVAWVKLFQAYHRSAGLERQRLEYVGLMFIVGYCIGCLNFLLVFNIPVDPLFGSLFGLYLVPMAYGIFSTDLLDIRIAVRRAFYYAFGITAITAFLIALVFLNDYIAQSIPGFQFWIVPLIVAIIVFSIGRSVLQKAQESEKLKYEFITVATHKLRTPLTRIRWVIPELLAHAGGDQELREGLRRIDDANNRMIELTNVLMEASHPGGTYDYQQIPVDLRHLAWETVKHFATQISEKKLEVTVDATNPPLAYGDARRLTLVVEVLVENAIMYTQGGGKIHITITQDRLGVRFAVTDTGIGVAREDRENIFSSFYRTNAARTADTEGVGLGLSLAKKILERQGGRIGIESEGEGKGSTFWFTMPVVHN